MTLLPSPVIDRGGRLLGGLHHNAIQEPYVHKLPFMWAPVYFVALLLIFIPISEVVLAAWPPRFGEVTWRYAAFGMIGQGVMTPLLGLLIVLWTAVELQQKWLVKAMGVLCIVGAIVFAGMLMLFALDTIQMRAAVAAEVQQAFDLATVAAFAKHFAGLVGTTLLAVAAHQNGKRLLVETRAKGSPSMVVAGSKSHPRAEK